MLESTFRSAPLLLTAGVALVAADSARAQAPESVFSFADVGPRTWVALVEDGTPSYAFANSLVVRGDDGLLVVDTQQSPSAARALIAEIRRREELPVRWVVNTHWHGDHVYGNAAYREAFPDVVLIASAATSEAVRSLGTERLTAEITEELPTSIEARRQWLASGVGPSGDTLTADQRAAVRRSLGLRERYLAELQGLELVVPEPAFRSDTVLDLGGLEVHLLALGPAHTVGDAAVWVPSDGVLAVGDLLEEAPPWIDGAPSLEGWSSALDRLASVEGVRVLLPAHGGLQESTELLSWQRAFFTAVVSAGREAASAGDLEAGGATVLEPFAAFRQPFAGLGLDDAGAFDRYVRDAVARAAREAASGS